MYEIYTAFMAWAGKYDSAGPEQRSRFVHEHWLRELPSRINVIRLDGLHG